MSDGVNCAVHFHSYVNESTMMNPDLFPNKMDQKFETVDTLKYLRVGFDGSGPKADLR